MGFILVQIDGDGNHEEDHIIYNIKVYFFLLYMILFIYKYNLFYILKKIIKLILINNNYIFQLFENIIIKQYIIINEFVNPILIISTATFGNQPNEGVTNPLYIPYLIFIVIYLIKDNIEKKKMLIIIIYLINIAQYIKLNIKKR